MADDDVKYSPYDCAFKIGDNKMPKDNVTYVASRLGDQENDAEEECIMFGVTKTDRRKHVEHPYKDPRAIVQCIGRIQSYFGEKDLITGNKIIARGTGTVFAVEGLYAFVLTCGHNVIQKDDDDNVKKAESIEFLRKSSKYGWETYKAEEILPHHRFIYENDEDDIVKNEANDLAIIKIIDDGFYKKMFTENGWSVNLFCSDNLQKYNQSSYIYHLYGYPSPPFHEKSIAEDEELYGMAAKSVDSKNGKEIYVKKGRKNKMLYYNAIDTEKGQSGSAIFIEGHDGEFHIVGTHICGTRAKNRGVALNKDKMNWINGWVKSADSFKIRIAIDFGTDVTGIYQISSDSA